MLKQQLWALLVVVVLTWILCLPVHAQLVVINDDYVVDEVHAGEQKLVVTPQETASAGDADVPSRFDVLLGPQTRVVDGAGHPVNWRHFKRGDRIHVNGGLRLNVKIQANTIIALTP